MKDPSKNYLNIHPSDDKSFIKIAIESVLYNISQIEEIPAK